MSQQKPRGRGRGRGILPVISTGQSTDEKKSVNDIIYQIDVLLLGGDGDNNQYRKLLESAQVAVKTKDDVHEIVAAIHNACLNDETFITVGSKLCSSLCPVEADGLKFKNVLLDVLQKDFEGREATRKDSPSRFYNSVKFLGQIFLDMRYGDNPIKIFSVALICYMEQMLESNTTKAESQLFQDLFQNCGRDLKSSATEEFENLLLKMREKIIETSTTQTERALLLRLFELCLQNWNKLSGNVEKLYSLNDIQV